jgi:hypothetical protein
MGPVVRPDPLAPRVVNPQSSAKPVRSYAREPANVLPTVGMTGPTARRQAEQALSRFGGQQRARDPAGFLAAQQAVAQARAAETAARQAYEAAAGPLLGAVQTQPPAVQTPSVVPTAAAAVAPTAPGTVPATMPPNALGAAPTRVTPEMQAQFDAQAAGIRAAELGTVTRADEELSAIDRGLKQRGLPTEARAELTRLRAQTAAARELLAQRGAAPAAAAPVTAAAAEAPPADAGFVAKALRPGVTPEKVDFQMYAVEPGRLTVEQRYLRQDYERQRQMITDAVVGQITDLDGAYQAQRQGLVAEFNAQLRAGQSAEAQNARDKIVQLDDQYRVARRQLDTQLQTGAFELDTKFRNAQLSLTSLAAAAQIEYQNDPTLASQVMSYAFGQPIRAQFRSDGNIDMLLPDREGDFQVRQTFSKQDFIVMLRDAADQAYRAARQQLAQAQALKVSEEQARMIREVAVARIQAGAKLQEITLQGRQYKLTPDGSGNVFLLRGDGSQAGIIRPGGGKIPGPGGTEIEAPPTIQWVSSMR